jgi:hypothetical protein
VISNKRTDRNGVSHEKELAMKNRMIRFASVLAFVLVTSFVQAQMPIKQLMMRVHVPFAFVAGGVHLPAGDYIVYHPGHPYLVVIETADGKARGMEYIHPSPTDPQASTTKLVFNKYADQYFLSQVWTEPDREVHRCFKCRMEKAMIARNSNPELVVVAAKH